MESPNPQERLQKARNLFHDIQRWIQRELPALSEELAAIVVPDGADVPNWENILDNFAHQVFSFLTKTTKEIGQQKILPRVKAWIGQQPSPAPQQVQASCQRLQSILARFAGTETEYQHLVAVAAVLKAELQAAQAPAEVCECFSLLDQLVHFRYRVGALRD